MLQGMTAHYLTHSTFPLKPGDTCLIHAAAGGAGASPCRWRRCGARFTEPPAPMKRPPSPKPPAPMTLSSTPARISGRSKASHRRQRRRRSLRFCRIEHVSQGPGYHPATRNDGIVWAVEWRCSALRPISESERIFVPDPAQPRAPLPYARRITLALGRCTGLELRDLNCASKIIRWPRPRGAPRSRRPPDHRQTSPDPRVTPANEHPDQVDALLGSGDDDHCRHHFGPRSGRSDGRAIPGHTGTRRAAEARRVQHNCRNGQPRPATPLARNPA